MGTDSNQDINEYLKHVVRIKSRQLIGKYGFNRSDQDDIEQDLMVDLLTGMPQFDRARAQLNTFIGVVVSRSVARLIRHRRQAMRDYRRCHESLNREITKDGVTVLDVVGPGYDERERIDLQFDLSECQELLPADLRDLVGDAGKESVADIERRTGRTRAAIRHAMHRVRQQMADKGLDIYLPSSQSRRRAHT